MTQNAPNPERRSFFRCLGLGLAETASPVFDATLPPTIERRLYNAFRKFPKNSVSVFVALCEKGWPFHENSYLLSMTHPKTPDTWQQAMGFIITELNFLAHHRPLSETNFRMKLEELERLPNFSSALSYIKDEICDIEEVAQSFASSKKSRSADVMPA